jgi:hypothetical protein
MLTEIIARDPTPAQGQRPVGPSTPLDGLILAFLGDGQPRELQEITRAVGGSTHKVHARAQSLVGKGLVTWTRIPGGPSRGPGASVYQLAAGN